MNISFMAKLQVCLSFNPLFSYHNTACENHKESIIHGETLLPEMEKKRRDFSFPMMERDRVYFLKLWLNFLVLQLSLGSKENWVNEKMVKVDAKSSDETHLVRHKSCSLVIKLHYSGMLYLSQKLAELLCNINQTVEYTNPSFLHAKFHATYVYTAN